MTRNFKHKKLGWVATGISEGDDAIVQYNIRFIISNYTNLNRGTAFSELIENSLDWEEVFDKDYEILTYSINGKEYSGSAGACDDIIITSVKCLSNGLIWMVGDKLYCGNISKFYIEQDKCIIVAIAYSDDKTKHNTYTSYIHQLKKPEEKTMSGGVIIAYVYDEQIVDKIIKMLNGD